MKGINMKSVVFSLGLLLLAATTSASVNSQLVMAKCQSQDQLQSLRLSRHFVKSEIGLIEYFDRVSERYKRIAAKVAYTNAGARAIFFYGGKTPLIVTGTGQSQVIFNSNVFNCLTDF